MDKGRIEQIGTPGDVYDNPATAFVHGFIGESIVLPVEVRDGCVRLDGKVLNIAADGVAGGASKLFVAAMTCRSGRPAAARSRARFVMFAPSVRSSAPRWRCRAARP